MKQIKLSVLLIAVLAFFTACQEKDFTPEVGNTNVEFVNTESNVLLTSEYMYIPLQMVEQSKKAAKVTVSFDGGTIITQDGELEVTVLENEHILITSKELYIGAYDEDADGEGLPTNSIEVRIPHYRDYKSISLKFSITSGNAAQNASTTFVAEAPEKGQVAGSYELTSTYDNAVINVTILADAADPTLFGLVGLIGGQDTEAGFFGTFADPTLTISNAPNTMYNQGGADIICCPFDGSSLYPKNQATLTITPEGFTSDNGIFVGFDQDGWRYFFLAMPGDQGVRL